MLKNFSEDNGKVIDFSAGKKYYVKLIDEKIEEGDLTGALSYAFAALKSEYSLDSLADIADIYAEMGLYPLSNEYWFRYLTIAPDNKKGVAYEELAINAFESKNFGLSVHYLQKKIAQDGKFENQDINEEVLEIMTSGVSKKDLYKIVYPTRLSDYSTEIAYSKAVALLGDYEKVVTALKDVPEDSPSFREAAEELSIAYYSLGEIEKAIELNRRLIKRFGENVSVYCSLSSFYKDVGDNEKSAYYYKKAVDLYDGGEEIKLALCAGERGDFATAVKVFDKSVDQDVYDPMILYCYGTSLINIGDYDRAAKIFNRACRIVPKDSYFKFYYELASNAAAGIIDDEYLPVPFSVKLPTKEIKFREKFLSSKSVKSSKIKKRDKERYYDYFRWGIMDDGTFFRRALLIATIDSDKGITEILKEALISDDVDPARKQAIIFILVSTGYGGTIAAEANGIFVSFKPRKVVKDVNEDLPFLAAYAVAVSKMFFSGEDLNKISFSANSVYKKLKGSEILKIISHEELAAAIVLNCKFEDIKSEARLYSVFEVKKERVQAILELL